MDWANITRCGTQQCREWFQNQDIPQATKDAVRQWTVDTIKNTMQQGLDFMADEQRYVKVARHVTATARSTNMRQFVKGKMFSAPDMDPMQLMRLCREEELRTAKEIPQGEPEWPERSEEGQWRTAQGQCGR